MFPAKGEAMPIANQTEVKVILADFENRIRSVVDRAWAEWRDHPNKGRYLFARTRSNILFDSIARIALEEFGEDPNIHTIAKNQTVQFLFRDQVLIRFKKGNSNGVGSNIVTQAILEFIDPQLSIPNLLPDVHRIEVCYQSDALGTQLKDVAVVARNRRARVWAYPLHETAPAAEVIPLPIAPMDDTPPLVTPKKKPDQGVTGEA
jgi:hypothetical protein